MLFIIYYLRHDFPQGSAALDAFIFRNRLLKNRLGCFPVLIRMIFYIIDRKFDQVQLVSLLVTKIVIIVTSLFGKKIMLL